MAEGHSASSQNEHHSMGRLHPAHTSEPTPSRSAFLPASSPGIRMVTPFGLVVTQMFLVQSVHLPLGVLPQQQARQLPVGRRDGRTLHVVLEHVHGYLDDGDMRPE